MSVRLLRRLTDMACGKKAQPFRGEARKGILVDFPSKALIF